MEQWRTIEVDGVVYDNYEVSNGGKVRNAKTGKILKSRIGSDGYEIVDIRKNGKAKTIRVHRVVGLMWLENEDNLPCLNHKDENKLNNHMDNLEWCTAQYNVLYSVESRKQKSKNCKGYRGVNDAGEVVEFYSVKELEQAGFIYGKVIQNIGGRNIHYKGFRWSKIWE